MSNKFDFKPATRGVSQILIALYAESGCGKTLSSLKLARGIVGAEGKIAMADTEQGRGADFFDLIPGGYLHAVIRPPFRPGVFSDALDGMIEAGAAIGIFDSFSHEWEGVGGVLEWADDNEAEGKKGALKWKDPKTAHNRLIQRILQSPIPLIFCVRAKYKTRVVKESGKNALVKDDHVSPLQNEEFIFEMTNHLQVNPDHTIYLTKKGHPSLAKCYPADGKEPLDIKHGEAIAAWARGAEPKTTSPADKLKGELWKLTSDIHMGDKRNGPAMVEKFLRDTRVIEPDESLSALTEDRLRAVIAAVKQLATPA